MQIAGFAAWDTYSAYNGPGRIDNAGHLGGLAFGLLSYFAYFRMRRVGPWRRWN